MYALYRNTTINASYFISRIYTSLQQHQFLHVQHLKTAVLAHTKATNTSLVGRQQLKLKHHHKGYWIVLGLNIFFCSLLGFNHAVLAQCTALQANMSIPSHIAVNQCFELQGGNIIKDNTLVQGKLIIKAGRKATLEPNAAIQIMQGGKLIVRGQLETRPYSRIHLQDSSFDCQGMVNIEANSQFSTSGANTLRNIGRMFFAPNSALILTGASSMRNSGQMLLEQAQLQLQNTSSLYSVGHITLRNSSTFTLTQQASLANDGRFNIDSKSQIYATDQSHINNKKQWLFAGLFTLTKDAILENHAPLRFQEDSKFVINQHGQILNTHTIEMGGQNNMSNSARMLNDGTLAVKKGGRLAISQNATVINNGTYRNEGGYVHVNSKQNFINENIITGRLSREQGRYNQRMQHQTEELELQTAPQYQPNQHTNQNIKPQVHQAQSSTAAPQSQQSQLEHQQPQTQIQPQQTTPITFTKPASPSSIFSEETAASAQNTQHINIHLTD